MKALLTGGAGSVGIHVIGHIMHNTDWGIVCLDSFRHKGYMDRLETTFEDHPDWQDRVKVIQHDLVAPINSKLKDEIGEVDYILHLAAVSDVQLSVDNPAYVYITNFMSTLNMLEYATVTPHKVFWYFSTDEVYGPVEKGKAHKEWSTMFPSNPYAASKGIGELMSYNYWREGKIKLVISNTMNNFGEMQSASKFPAMVQSALNRGEEIEIHGNDKEIGSRFYIHSRNVADAMLFVLKNFDIPIHKTGEIDRPLKVHIVGEKRLDNLQLAQTIAKTMGKPLKYRMKDFHKDNPAHDIHYGLEDNILRPSGWEQPLSFEESLSNTIDWQQINEEWLQ